MEKKMLNSILEKVNEDEIKFEQKQNENTITNN